MPRYDYECTGCGMVFEEQRAMFQANDAIAHLRGVEGCGAQGKRLYSVPQISVNHWIPDPREMNGEKEFIAAGGYD